MLEEAKAMKPDDTVVFADEQVADFTGSDELRVTGVKVYAADDGELVVVELDDFFVAVHTFQSEERCFLYQPVEEGDVSEVEENGYRFLNDDDDFRNKIVVRDDGGAVTFRHSDAGAVYGLVVVRDDGGGDEPDEAAVCEFAAGDEYILIERADGWTRISRGFEVAEGALKFL